MSRILTIAALLGVAACSRQEQPAAPANEMNDEAAQQAPASEQALPELQGKWVIAAIDGKPVSPASAMIATFAAGKATIASGCLRRGWTFTQKRNVLTFATDPGSSSNCGGGTSGEQETAYAALEKASIVIFSRNGNEANLSGTGGNLRLERR